MSMAAFLCLAAIAVDGDTLRCRDQGLVRLMSIDAPELAGHCRTGRRCTPGDGDASARELARLIARGPVRCKPVARDAYGRILARCRTRRTDLGCAMVAAGFAVERYGRLICP